MHQKAWIFLIIIKMCKEWSLVVDSSLRNSISVMTRIIWTIQWNFFTPLASSSLFFSFFFFAFNPECQARHYFSYTVQCCRSPIYANNCEMGKEKFNVLNQINWKWNNTKEQSCNFRVHKKRTQRRKNIVLQKCCTGARWNASLMTVTNNECIIRHAQESERAAEQWARVNRIKNTLRNYINFWIVWE